MYVTTFSPFSVTQDEFDALAKVNYGIVSRIDFEYFDAYRTKYTNTVCVALLGNGVIAFPSQEYGPLGCEHPFCVGVSSAL